MNVVAVFLIYLCASCAHGQSTKRPAIGSIDRKDRLLFMLREIDNMQEDFLKKIDVYKRDQECKGRSFADLENHIHEMFYRFDDYIPWADISIYRSYLIPTFQIQPSDLADIGDVAVKKQCYDIARTEYMDILRIFPGGAYTAARQRAQIALEEIRGK
jgi:hypothetical protein